MPRTDLKMPILVGDRIRERESQPVSAHARDKRVAQRNRRCAGVAIAWLLLSWRPGFISGAHLVEPLLSCDLFTERRLLPCGWELCLEATDGGGSSAKGGALGKRV